MLIDQKALNLNRLLFDGSLIQCTSNNEHALYNPRRGKRCINRLIACNSKGIPVVLIYAKGTANDTKFLIPLFKKIPHKIGFHAHADKGFDSFENRLFISRSGGSVHIPLRDHGFASDVPCPKEKDMYRPKVEHSFSWINKFKSLKIVTE